MPHIINAQIELLQIYLSTEVAEPRRHFGALRIYYHESRFCAHVRAMNITQAGAFCYFEALFSPRLDIRQPRRVNPEVLDLDVITAPRTHPRRRDQAPFAFAAVLLDENLNVGERVI